MSERIKTKIINGREELMNLLTALKDGRDPDAKEDNTIRPMKVLLEDNRDIIIGQIKYLHDVIDEINGFLEEVALWKPEADKAYVRGLEMERRLTYLQEHQNDRHDRNNANLSGDNVDEKIN